MRSHSLKLDGAALTRLFESHSEELMAFFARRTFDPQAALDLVGETFAVAFESRARCRAHDAAELRAWLFGIGRNQLKLFYRDGYIEQRALRRLAVETLALSDESYERIEQLAELPSKRDRLAEAMSGLSAQHREVLQLRVVEERSYDEIAAALVVSEQVVRARVSRALRALRGSLDLCESKEVAEGV